MDSQRWSSPVFEALGQGLSPDQPKPARSVRASIVNHLQRHAARYQPWWDQKEPTKEEGPCESWEVGAWGGSIALAAAAVHYDRPIVVFQPTGVPEIYNGQRQAGSAILCGIATDTMSFWKERSLMALHSKRRLGPCRVAVVEVMTWNQSL